MARPNQPKDIKPKAEEEGSKAKINDNVKMIIINLASTILICILFISVNYVLQENLLNNKLAQTAAATDEEGVAAEEDSEEVAERGIIVDLGDFILNLSDVSPRKYLKVNVALELSRKETDPSFEAPAPAAGGHGGGEAAPSPEKLIETEMAQFKPAIRDAVITNLSSKSAAELATVAGKELAKEQIAEAVNAIFAGEREVIRVSFGQFIIQ